MDTAVRKSNKENTKPAAALKRPESRNITSKQKPTKVAPLQSKNDLKEEKKKGDMGEKAEAKEQVRPVTKTNAADPNKRKTLSQAFRTELAVRHRKLVVEAQKPPPTAPPKPIPGTYKGRVVKSKIDCFRKPSSGEEKAAEAAVPKFAKPSVPKPKPEVSALSKVRSKSVTTLPGSSRPPRPQPNLPSRTKSASDAQLNVPEKPVHRSISQRQIPPKAPASGRPPMPRPATVLSRPAPVTTARPASTKVTSFIKKKEPAVQSVKPKPAAPAVEQKAQRPAQSTLSQYRVRMETAEERKAKLAEWLANKGKSLKRPPMSEKTAPPASKPAPPPKATQEVASEVAQLKPQAEPEENPPVCPETRNTQPERDQAPQSKPAFSSSPGHIMNTTLDLLDNSDMDLPVDPEIRMESLVLNLCEKLDAMETPSLCENDAEVLANIKVEEDMDKEYEILEEEELGIKQDPVEDDAADRKEVKVEEKDVKPFKDEVSEEEEDSEDEKTDITPAEVTEASVVKYSVKTTPFLQSVKKRIETEGETAGSASRCKSAIKDLKFLTPVRRSSRIQRKSSRLPDMLNEHDPCVSSLAELVQLDDADSNAYIYRKNPALLGQLPDQAGDLEGLPAERK